MKKKDPQNKNVLILTRFYPPHKGGVEVVAQHHAKYFQKLNYKVHVLCFHKNTKKYFLRTKGEYHETITSFKPTFNIQSFLFSFCYFIYALYKCLSASKNTIIEIHHPSPLDSFIVSLSCYFKKIRLITTYHADIMNKNKILELLSLFWIKRSLQKSKKIIFTSNALLNKVTKKYPIFPQAVCIPIEAPFLCKSVPKNRDPKAPFTVLFIGRLVGYKGVQYLIEALSELKNVKLHIFGTGPLKSSLQDLTQTQQLQNSVSFHENLSEEHKIKLLEHCHCLVLPSINQAEAFGVVQLEALCYALPVINTQLPTGVPEVSVHLKSGLTVEPKNVAALQEALRLLQTDLQLYHTLSQGAQKQGQFFQTENIFHLFSNLCHDLGQVHDEH